MNHRSFQTLLAELSRTIGAADTRTLPGAGLCRFNGFDVAIYHDERTDPNHIHAYIDFGPVPAARQCEVFRMLLRHMHLTPLHRAVVGLDSASGNIVLVAHIPFDADLSGARMAGTLRQLIRQVLIWRAPTPTTRLPAGRRATSRRPS